MKLKFVAAGAALCALGMTGCTHETDEAGAQAGKQVVMTMQSATDVPQTRADYTEDGTDDTKMNFSWRSGDKMSVVVDGVTGNENCELTATAAGKSAPFSGTVTTWTGTKDIYAFYPFSSTTYAISNGTTTLTLPTTQLYTIGGAISNSFMVGVGTATATDDAINASVSMKQVMSIIKLNITNAPAKVTGVKLKCAEALFPTTATVTLSDATITNPGNLVNELLMTVTDATTEATKAVSLAMFPTSELKEKYITIEVTFNDGTDDIVRAITKKGIEFKRNTHYVMDFSAADNIEVNGIKVAVGNLVADGPNGAKIGAATDNGLLFQFSSLVGWNATSGDPTIAVKPVSCTVNSWSIFWNFSGDLSTNPNLKDEIAGTGDPCRYYLGNPWRLPTPEEFKILFPNADNAYLGRWTWAVSSALHSSGLEFPASNSLVVGSMGSQNYSTGYYWAFVQSPGRNSFGLYFNSSHLEPEYLINQASGLPVRCVRASN